MRIIKTEKDLKVLKNSNVLDRNFMAYIHDYFYKLVNTLKEFSENLDDFNLSRYGYIVLLEKGDNLRDLSIVGLNPEDNGLLGAIPEFINKLTLGSKTFYEIGILYDNEYMMMYYIEKGVSLDEEIEGKLSEYAI